MSILNDVLRLAVPSIKEAIVDHSKATQIPSPSTPKAAGHFSKSTNRILKGMVNKPTSIR